jgi:hypothetical protein
MQYARRVGVAAVWSVAVLAIAAADAGEVPPEIAVGGTPVASVHAKGVQVYVCKMKDGERVWAFKAPQATFSGNDSAGNKIEGKHHMGESGPVWEAGDGSSVSGRKIREHACANAIPLLLIQATGHQGSGALSSVTFVQRLNTTGGVPPAIGDAKVGDEVKVEYTAEYVFYGPGATTQPAGG